MTKPSLPLRRRAQHFISNYRAGNIEQRLEPARTALQQLRYEQAVASAEQVLEDSSLSFEEEAIARCVLAEALERLARFQEAVAALTPYEEQSARDELPPEIRSMVCLRAAFAGFSIQRDRSVTWAKDALTLAEKHRQPDIAGDACHLLGRLYRQYGETGFAQEYYLRARWLHQQARNPANEVRDLVGLGGLLITKGNLTEAAAAFQQAEQLLGDREDPYLRGKIALDQATIFHMNGHLADSAAKFERAVHYFEQSREPRLLVTAWINLGLTQLRLGETTQAQQTLNEAAVRAVVAGMEDLKATTQGNLGELLMVRGQLAEAEKLLQGGLAALHVLKLPHVEAQDQITLGRCFLMQQRVATAEKAFRRSLNIARQINDQRGLMEAQLWLTEIHLERNETDPVRTLLDTISHALEEAGNSQHLPQLCHLLSLTGRLALRDQQFEKALRLLEQALSVAELTGYQWLSGMAHYHLAQLSRQLGWSARFHEACVSAEKIFARMEAAHMQHQVAALRIETATTTAMPAPVVFSDAEILASSLMRLQNAASHQDLLLCELTRILHREYHLTPVILYESAEGRMTTRYHQGCDNVAAAAIAATLTQPHAQTSSAIRQHDLRLSNGQHLILCFADGLMTADSLMPGVLLQQVEMLLRSTPPLPQPKEELPGQAPALLPLHLVSPGQTSGEVLYQSPAMAQVIARIQQLQGSNINVLLTGETGTGKEVISREIHRLSPRAAQIFVAFNCAELQPDLAESQLFGHRKGAFTGAHENSRGIIRSADGGTLFLDEVGELPLSVQTRLLRFLETGEVRSLGEEKPHKVSVRIIAATNRDLSQMIAEGQFRADLFFRLNVIGIHLSPLRERREEIPLLAHHFLVQFSAQEQKEGLHLTAAALDTLIQHNWPGNVRELANEMRKQAALLPGSTAITPAELSPNIISTVAASVSATTATATSPPEIPSLPEAVSATDPAPPSVPPSAARLSLADAVEELQRRMVKEALERHQGNRTRAAEDLGLTRRGLLKMLERYKDLPPT